MKALRILLALTVALLAVGCARMPTESQSVVDLRPSISFRLLQPAAAWGEVFVDDLRVGRAGDYAEGEGALRILPGTHLLRVVKDGQVLLNEKIYLADGVNRTFILSVK